MRLCSRSFHRTTVQECAIKRSTERATGILQTLHDELRVPVDEYLIFLNSSCRTHAFRADFDNQLE